MIEQSKTGIGMALALTKTAGTKAKGKGKSAGNLLFEAVAAGATTASSSSKPKLSFADLIKPRAARSSQTKAQTVADKEDKTISPAITAASIMMNYQLPIVGKAKARTANATTSTKSDAQNPQTALPIKPIYAKGATKAAVVEHETDREKVVLSPVKPAEGQHAKNIIPVDPKSTDKSSGQKFSYQQHSANDSKVASRQTTSQAPTKQEPVEASTKTLTASPLSDNITAVKSQKALPDKKQDVQQVANTEHGNGVDTAKASDKSDTATRATVEGQSHKIAQVSQDTELTSSKSSLEVDGQLQFISAPPQLNNSAYAAVRSEQAANLDTKISQISDQVIEPLQTASTKLGQSITVNLNPPDLGSVSIRFEKQDDGIVGRLEVEKASTRDQLEAAMPKLIQSLQNSGVEIKNIDLVAKEQQFHDNFQDLSGSQSQDFARGESRQTSYNHASGTAATPTIDLATPQHADSAQYVGDRGVNVWA